jgi:Big-like domain-containing protein
MRTALAFALGLLLGAPLAAQCVHINRGYRDTTDVVVVSVSFADNTPQGDRAELTDRIIDGVQQWNDTDCQIAAGDHAYPRFARAGEPGTDGAPVLDVVYHEGTNPNNPAGCGEYDPNVPHIFNIFTTAHVNNLSYPCNVVLEDNAAHEAGHELGLHHPSSGCSDHSLIMQPVYYPPHQSAPVDREIHAEECAKADEQNRTESEREPPQTYTLRGQATMPDFSSSSVELRAEFEYSDGSNSVESLSVSSSTEFAFGAPLTDGTSYGVTPTVPDSLDCFIGPDRGKVAGGPPPEIRVFCTNRVLSFCDIFPHACAEAGYPDPYQDDIPWTTAWFCYPQQSVVYVDAPCVNQTTGEPTGAMCSTATVVTRNFCLPCINCLEASTVEVAGPTVSLWAPLDGASVTGRVAVTGWAAHASGTVDGARFWVDDQPVLLESYRTGLYAPEACGGEKACNPYVGFLGFLDTAGLAEGGHTLKAISVEDNPTTPGITFVEQSFVVDHTLPVVSITAPANHAVVNGTVVVTANASDNTGVAKVEFRVDGALAATDTAAPYAYNWNAASASAGSHTLVARAFDAAGNSASSSVEVTVPGGVAPQVTLTAPAAGALVRGQVQMQAQATDDVGVTRVEFYVDGNLKGTDTSAPYVYSWNTTLTPDGDRVLSAKAFDAGNNFGSSPPVTVQVDNTVPAMYLDSPASGATVSGTSVAIVGWATDRNRVVSLAFKLDGQTLPLNSPYWYGASRPDACNLHPEDPNCPLVGWSALFNSRNYSDGNHTIEVIATDGAGLMTSIQRALVFANDGGIPTATITSPSAGSNVRGTVSIQAQAADDVGVTRVEFYVDGALKGTDSSAPYAYGWDTTASADGNRVLLAKAFDAAGHFGDSAPVTVQVDNAVPRLYLDGPANNATVSGTAVTIYGWATDRTRVVLLAFKLDGQTLPLNSPYWYGASRPDVCNVYPEDPNCPIVGWSALFNSRNYSDGSHTLEVIATDGVGLTTSIQRTLIFANDGGTPTAAITAPSGGSNVRGVVSIQAQATDDGGVTRVEFYVDGVLKGTDSSAPYAYSWDTTASADGNRVLLAKAFDAAGHFGNSASVTVQVDNTVPWLYLDGPANNATVSGTAVTIYGWATDRTRVVSLAFKLDGQTLPLNSPYWYGASRPDVCSVHPEDPNCPIVGWSALFNSRNYSNGSHTLEVIATDGVGLTASVQRTLVFANDGGAPSVTITAPSAGSNVRGVVSIQAQASDDVGVTRVEFYVDGALKGTDTSAPYAYSWDTTASADGNHALTAKAFDAAGNVGNSPSVTVQVDNAVPRLSLDGPANNATVSGTAVTIFGWATDRTRVVSLAFKIDGQTLPLNSPYWYGASRPDVCNLYPGDPNCPVVGWSALFNSKNYSNGSHTIQVIATDGVGLTATTQLTLSFAN